MRVVTEPKMVRPLANPLDELKRALEGFKLRVTPPGHMWVLSSALAKRVVDAMIADNIYMFTWLDEPTSHKIYRNPLD